MAVWGTRGPGERRRGPLQGGIGDVPAGKGHYCYSWHVAGILADTGKRDSVAEEKQRGPFREQGGQRQHGFSGLATRQGWVWLPGTLPCHPFLFLCVPEPHHPCPPARSRRGPASQRCMASPSFCPWRRTQCSVPCLRLPISSVILMPCRSPGLRAIWPPRLAAPLTWRCAGKVRQLQQPLSQAVALRGRMSMRAEGCVNVKPCRAVA